MNNMQLLLKSYRARSDKRAILTGYRVYLM
jgi:hypothetical protein